MSITVRQTTEIRHEGLAGDHVTTTVEVLSDGVVIAQASEKSSQESVPNESRWRYRSPLVADVASEALRRLVKLVGSVAVEMRRQNLLKTSGTWHHLQCLNGGCGQQVVVNVRLKTVTPDMTMPCPHCRVAMTWHRRRRTPPLQGLASERPDRPRRRRRLPHERQPSPRD
jgi:hypothetical protein